MTRVNQIDTQYKTSKLQRDWIRISRMYKLLRFDSCLRLSTYILKTKHEFKFAALNMSSYKRNSDGLNNSSPCKIRCVKTKENNQIEQKLSIVESSIVNNKTEMSVVEVMETPDKSENDKKSYRVIRLENGLKALLISDPNQNSTPHDGEIDDHTHKHKHEIVAASDEEEDSDSESEKHLDESDEEDDDGNENQKKRGKLAACSLCVDVGSFSDPRDVQGLAHFLGKINLSLVLNT